MHLIALALLVVLALLVLARIINKQNQRDRANQSNLNELYTKLDTDVFEVSQLIALNCPRNTHAHRALIEAAKCLVFPKVDAHTVVTASMIEARYRQGFAHLETARSMSTGIRK